MLPGRRLEDVQGHGDEERRQWLLAAPVVEEQLHLLAPLGAELAGVEAQEAREEAPSRAAEGGHGPSPP